MRIIKNIRKKLFSEKQDLLYEFERISHLPLSGSDDRQVFGENLCTEKRSASKRYFTEDDRKAKRLFCMIVGWRHAFDFKESKQPVAITFWI